jgi:GNAT superfamily N-acetyltransferase
MKLERFDAAADSESVRACHDIFLAGAPADDPDGPPMLSRRFAAWLKLGWTEDPQECWLARGDSGEPCGWYLLALPQRENRHLAELTLVVHPARRRAGLGTALLAHAGARAGELGRTVLQSGARGITRLGFRSRPRRAAGVHRRAAGAGSPGRDRPPPGRAAEGGRVVRGRILAAVLGRADS